MAIKINFTGAQGTGKTTILEALREDPDFEGFEFVSEIVRRFIKELRLRVNQNGTVETQKIIFQAYKSLLDREDSFISDRCIVDVYSYTTASVKGLPLGKERTDFANCLYDQREVLLDRGKDLGLVFYFPVEFPLVSDGVRSPDPEYQEEIDSNILSTLKTMEIPYITVSGTVEERIAIIKQVLLEQS